MKKLLITLAAVLVSSLAMAQSGNKNYVKTTSYQEPVQNEAEIDALPQNDKLQSINYYDGLGRPEQSIALRQGGQANITNELTYDWESGNIGSTNFFVRNGSESENSIITGTTPYGDTDLLWECHNQDGDVAGTSMRPDGGWNTQFFAVDKTVGYRYSVWVKRTHSVTDGRTYHGTKNVSDLNGVSQPNPYFYVSYGTKILPQVDTWYLMVGIIHPFDYTGEDTGESGVYDIEGNKILDGKEFKWNPSTTVSRFRNYLYYTQDTNVKQYFYKPLLQRLDGQELTLPQIANDNFAQDIVSPVVYDMYGRQTKEYLPHAELTFGDFTPNDQIISNAENYYINNYNADLNATTPNIYSEKHLEASPLGRVLEQAAPGEDWKLDTALDTDHTIKFEYDTNTATEVPYYRVIFPTGNTEAPQLFHSGNYQENQLYKNVTKDENWQPLQNYEKDHTTEAFKNKQGQVILKRTYNNNVPHDTQYVYDDYGNLTFVLSPNASDAVLYDNHYPNYSNTHEYIEIIPSDSEGAPVTVGDGIVNVDVSEANQTIEVEFSFGLYSETNLKTGPVLQLNQNIPDVVIGTLSGAGYSYIVSVQNGYIYLSGSGNVTSINQALNATLPSQSIDPNAIDNLGYQYHYDYRNRLIEKKIPGKGWEYIIYDKLDRPVLTQDANLRKTDHWLFTKYDAFNRVIYTGKHYYNPDNIINNSDRIALSDLINAQTSFSEVKAYSSGFVIGDVRIYHNNRVMPRENIEVYTVNYYDEYPPDIYNEINNVGVFVLAGQNIEISDNTKALATGSKVRILGTSQWITTATYYDDKARPVYVGSNNDYLGTKDVVKSALDFVGKVLETESSHEKNAITITTNNVFTYDHANRLLTQTQSINNGTPELIVNNGYDDLGQLVNKKVGGTVASTPETSTGLQSVDYSYNIRGWLKQINDVDNIANDLFSFKLNYNTQEGAVQLGNLYNGNISQSIWRTANIDPIETNEKRGYAYNYDALNRLKLGTKVKGNTLTQDVGYHLNRVDYDKSGNILQLTRYNATVPMDDLSYKYQGNQLLEVIDGVTTYNGEGFKDGNTIGSDYVYDANGNMIEDKNKDITEILYNHLNLPKKITFNNDVNKNIEYIYDATGVKQAKVVTEEEDLTTTKYAGNFIYEENAAGETLKFFNHPEGYVEPTNTGFQYVYQFKDHLGNIRLSYSDSDNDGSITVPVTEVFNDGLESATGWSTITTYDSNFKYSGSYSGKIEKLTSGEKYVNCDTWITIDNTEATNYTFSGWIYSDNPSAEIFMFMKTENETNAYTTFSNVYATGGLNQWNYVEKTVSVPANIKYLNVRVDNNGGGTIWFDNIKIEKVNNSLYTEIIEEKNYYPFGLKHKGYNDVVSANVNSVASKFEFQGVEFEEALGLNLHEMDFRNYDPAIGRFIQIDPLGEERYSLTPYNFVQNNPILRIDPLGLLDDTYGVDNKGNIKKIDDKKYYDENGKEIDRIYAVDDNGKKVDANGDGKVNESDSAEADVNTLSGVTQQKDGKGRKYDEFFHKDGSRSDKLFEFLAENTDVEWGKVDENRTNSWISTSHSVSKEWGASSTLSTLLSEGNDDNDFYEHTHSHPRKGGLTGYTGPSGFHKNDKLYGKGDKAFAKIKSQYRKKLITLRVYDVKTKSYIQYTSSAKGVPVKKKN